MSSEYNKGYQRGLDGKDSSSSWGDLVGDSTVNKSGSYDERRSGYEQGCRDRALLKAQQKNNK